jgi:hypothetical protein
MVVAGTANVAVMSDTVLGSGVGKRPATFEQMLDISRRTGTGRHRSQACRLHLFARVAGRQAQNTETGSHTLLDMIASGQQPLDIGGGMCSSSVAQWFCPASRTWLAARSPRWKICTPLRVMKTSTRLRTSAYGTE